MENRDVRISYKAARVNANYTQAEAAKLLNISEKTLNNYESGATSPNWTRHEEMAKLYNIPKEMLSPLRD